MALLEVRSPTTSCETTNVELVACHDLGVVFGHGRDEFRRVAGPSAVASLGALSPRNECDDRHSLPAECAVGSPDSQP